ncbi:ubiquitin carboxyl-terminal hydrolase, partial [Cystoisospora suis]
MLPKSFPSRHHHLHPPPSSAHTSAPTIDSSTNPNYPPTHPSSRSLYAHSTPAAYPQPSSSLCSSPPSCFYSSQSPISPPSPSLPTSAYSLSQSHRQGGSQSESQSSSCSPSQVSSSERRSQRRRSLSKIPLTRCLVGLRNFGNTCYCNAPLQILFSCERFCRYFLLGFNPETDINPHSSYQSLLVEAWISLLKHVYSQTAGERDVSDLYGRLRGRNEEREPYHPSAGSSSSRGLSTSVSRGRPSLTVVSSSSSSSLSSAINHSCLRLLNLIRKKHSQFAEYQQCDAHEFLRTLLDGLSMETNRAGRIASRKGERRRSLLRKKSITSSSSSLCRKKEEERGRVKEDRATLLGRRQRDHRFYPDRSEEDEEEEEEDEDEEEEERMKGGVIDDVKGENPCITSERFWKASLSKEASIVTDLFAGQLVTRIDCEACMQRRHRFDSFLDLSLEFPSPSSLSFSSSYKTYGGEERADERERKPRGYGGSFLIQRRETARGRDKELEEEEENEGNRRSAGSGWKGGRESNGALHNSSINLGDTSSSSSSSKICNLSDMLSYAFSGHRYDREYLDCPFCKNRRPARIYRSLWRLPSEYLVLHIKRFAWSTRYEEMSRINTRLKISKEIDMRPYCSFSDHPSCREPFFRLEGVVSQSGTADSGHYTALTSIEGGGQRGRIQPGGEGEEVDSEQWMYYSDDYVTSSSTFNPDPRGVYLLLFRRISPSQSG